MRRSENADFFHDGEAVPRPQRLCYSNCDILLMQDFSEALGRLKEAHSKFLMVGRHGAFCFMRCANSYLRAFAALFLGYHHLHLLDAVQMRRKRLFAYPVGNSEASEKEKVLAAKG
jgi:hypothetical protein